MCVGCVLACLLACIGFGDSPYIMYVGIGTCDILGAATNAFYTLFRYVYMNVSMLALAVVCCLVCSHGSEVRHTQRAAVAERCAGGGEVRREVRAGGQSHSAERTEHSKIVRSGVEQVHYTSEFTLKIQGGT